MSAVGVSGCALPPPQQEAESLGCGSLFGKRHQEPQLSVCIQAVCAAAPVGVA